MEAGGSSSSATLTNEVYKECLRNHAAGIGSYATDGCGEFTLDNTSNTMTGELKCAACGCHRNFHRKVNVVSCVSSTAAGATGGGTTSRGGRGKELGLAAGEMVRYNAVADWNETAADRSGSGGGFSNKKRVRTKFTMEQKQMMLEFAEKIGWKIRRSDDEEIQNFCRNLGVSRQVFKVWMHNHKSIASSSTAATMNTRSSTPPPPAAAGAKGNASSLTDEEQ